MRMLNGSSSSSMIRQGAALFGAGLLLACGTLGCAGTSAAPEAPMDFTLDWEPTFEGPDVREVVTPRGPGAVFASPERAALDALAYSYLASRQRPVEARRVRAGAILAVDGGFAYGEPTIGARDGLRPVRYVLSRDAVAHYRHYPKSANLADRFVPTELHGFVDREDPEHRSLYFLLPDRRVRHYDASELGEETIARIELGARRDATQVAVHRSRATGDALSSLAVRSSTAGGN